MTSLEVLQQIEDGLKSVPALSTIPIHHGINATTHRLEADYPKIVVQSLFPSTEFAKVGYSRINQQIKICLYKKMPTKNPTDINSIASIHDDAKYLREAINFMAANADFDIDSEPKQEIAFIEFDSEIMVDLTISYAE